jgi:hypothetical protein
MEKNSMANTTSDPLSTRLSWVPVNSVALSLENSNVAHYLPHTFQYVQSRELLNDFLRSFWQQQFDAAEQETLITGVLQALFLALRKSRRAIQM